MRAKKIQKFNPCHDALQFIQSCKTYKEAWEKCNRGDWMLWIAQRLEVDEKTLFLAKGKCAETVIHLMKNQRSKDAVKAAIDYGNGIIFKDVLEQASAAAYAAAYASNAAAYAAVYASDAAFDAASDAAADAAAYAAYTAAYASDAASDAASDTAAYASAASDAAASAAAYTAGAYSYAICTLKENQKKTSDICRKILQKEVFKQIKK